MAVLVSSVITNKDSSKPKGVRRSRSSIENSISERTSLLSSVGGTVRIDSGAATTTHDVFAETAASNEDNASSLQRLIKTYEDARQFIFSRKGKNILKCSVAYFIGSLAVYTPIGTWLYGHSDNKHMICTVCVYFHPARTAGSMTEAILFALFALAFGLIIALSSMIVSALFTDWDLIYVGYVIDLLVFVGGGLGVIAFTKQMVNKPTFNTACSLASIFLVTILTKEGNVQAGTLSLSKLLQSFMFVLSGVILSTTISYLVWPESAILKLKESLNKSMDVHSDLLTFIANKFINGQDINTSEFEKLNEELSKTYKSLQTNLHEAKFELLSTGRECEYEVFQRLIQSSNSLSLHLGGLSNSANIQWHLLNGEESDDESQDESTTNGDTDVTAVRHRVNGSARPDGRDSDDSSVTSIEDIISRRSVSPPVSGESSSAIAPDSVSAELFSIFTFHLGPPMISFFSTIKEILDNLPFGNSPNYEVSLHPQYKASLDLATELYSTAREEALAGVYAHEIFQVERDFDTAADEEAIAASCGNFSYVLEDFGWELSVFITALEDYRNIIENRPRRSFKWARFWESRSKTFDNSTSSGTANDNTGPDVDGADTERGTDPANPLRRSPTANTHNVKSFAELDWLIKKSTTEKKQKTSLSLRIWRSMHAFRRTDVQFGIKVGIGAIIFAIPAFSPSLRPIFSTWRGEWGLITYAIVMSKSVGGTTVTIPIRFLGTLLGAAAAFVAWTLFPENQYVLSFLGWVMACLCFYIILFWDTKQAFGRFILLTFNLTVLYSYSLTVYDNDDDDDEGGAHPIVREIAFHRFVSVFVGSLWAVFIAFIILPNSARKRLRDILSVQWLKMGLVWKADCLKTIPRKSAADEPRLVGIQGEADLQSTMVELQTLLGFAPNELRLKGPFPTLQYKNILNCTQRILDGFQNIGVLVAKYPKPSSNELELIAYTAADRRELCSRIFLFFYLISSAIKLGFPLPDKLPSTTHAIDRMLAKMSDYRQRAIAARSDHGDSSTTASKPPPDEEDFVLFYSYLLVTVSITEELAKIAIQVQDLFGTIEEDMFTVS
ncbi:Protein BRE4 [Sugiyamaella lignohabitans]|uniref:Protein BRE4 n=1 Tax=Sugiyamaella lignohabitans TaxID=796027 RepID=A0A167F0S4_9ASCO|nr:Protein BRE4 [Sugiyamaella lignohabitans]ANB14682.1 Protein BRE4 [Sugiyamaella lignohabitans]